MEKSGVLGEIASLRVVILLFLLNISQGFLFVPLSPLTLIFQGPPPYKEVLFS